MRRQEGKDGRAGEEARGRRKEAERQEAGQRREAMGWEESWKAMR